MLQLIVPLILKLLIAYFIFNVHPTCLQFIISQTSVLWKVRREMYPFTTLFFMLSYKWCFRVKNTIKTRSLSFYLNESTKSLKSGTGLF